jgi:tetratricopeptide (TPR) repeat protein
MLLRDEHETGVTLHNIADVQRQRNEPDRAVANYRRVLTHKDAARDRYSVLLTRLALRELLAQIGREADALETGQEAIDLLLLRPEADLRALGYTMAIQTQALADSGRAAKGAQVLGDWMTRLANRASEGVAHPYWGVRALATGLCLRSLALTNALVIDDPITLIDLAERAVETAEAEKAGTWVAWAARRDLGWNGGLTLTRFLSRCWTTTPPRQARMRRSSPWRRTSDRHGRQPAWAGSMTRSGCSIRRWPLSRISAPAA